MSHPEQLGFFEAVAVANSALVRGSAMLEVGSYDVNGTVRGIFGGAERYVGVDLVDGPGVDVVGYGHELDHPDGSFDATISGECFEHDPHWADTFANMTRMTRPGGLVAFTCASRGRPEHGTRRTDARDSPGTQAEGLDYYRNLTEADFARAIRLSDSFDEHCFWFLKTSFDLYFAGVRSGVPPPGKVRARLPNPADVSQLRKLMPAAHRIVRLPLRPFAMSLREARYQSMARPYWSLALRLGGRVGARPGHGGSCEMTRTDRDPRYDRGSNLPGRSGRIEFLVPHYGSEPYLREAVDSVLHQTDPNWCLTVVEDGAPSTSPIESWLQSLNDSRVRYERNTSTLGVAGNFQRCLDLASGEFVTFLGCDDRLMPRYVECVSQALAAHPAVSVVQPSVRVIDLRGEVYKPFADRLKRWLAPHSLEPRNLAGERLLVSLMRGNWTYFPSLAWRREALDPIGFRQDLDVALDLVALASLVLDGATMLLLPDVVFEYRRHVGSVSSQAATSAGRFIEERRVMGELAARARECGWRRASRAAHFRFTSRAHAVALLPDAIRSRSWDPARKFVRHAFGP